ncbi:MAG TPA: SPOR domain-containing protein [Flavobacteriaceae bacterium]|jgi:hypothetical protein|nr:SPOR domain-containing protein [Flavobacteriaceae bacterium]
MRQKILCYTAFGLFNALAFSAWGQRDSLLVSEAKSADKINWMLEDYQALNRITSAYRIQIYAGNYQNAQKIMAEAQSAFPDTPVFLDFRSPSYRVRVGAFATRLAAEKKLIAIRRIYKTSVLIKPEKTL